MSEYTEETTTDTGAPFEVVGFQMVDVNETEEDADEFAGYGEPIDLEEDYGMLGGYNEDDNPLAGLEAFFAMIEEAQKASALAFLQQGMLAGIEAIVAWKTDAEIAEDGFDNREDFAKAIVLSMVSAFVEVGISKELWLKATGATAESVQRSNLEEGRPVPGASLVDVLVRITEEATDSVVPVGVVDEEDHGTYVVEL